MTFLQPLVLLGLPLVLVPVIIHLLNRMRHRPRPWAAMRFLVAATRSSISNTRLRQFLILLCRVLAVAMLVLFLARPLAGGWLGWALSPPPDAILIVLDRSASMETQAGPASKRQQALALLAQAARPFEERSRLVLIDSATRQAQEIGHASALEHWPAAQPTDTAADLPALLRAAYDWLIENRAGAAEIWIASDGQRSNWLPEDPRWKTAVAQLGGLSQRIRVRLLDLDQPAEANASISIKELLRRPRADKSELQFVLDLQRNRNSSTPIPVAVTLDGQKTETEVKLDGQSLRWRYKVDLGSRNEGGWGSFALPADGNLHDNTAYFVYGPNTPLLASVVSGEAGTARYFEFAAASHTAQPAELVAPSAMVDANLDGRSLLVWQAPLPAGAEAARVQSFAEAGGVVAFFPSGQADPGQFAGLGWGSIQNAEGEEGFHVLRWDEDEGPLAKSDEHSSLPLAQTTFQRRQLIVGQKETLAAFEDGTAFLVRQSLGKGEIYFCATLPDPAWSSLGDGPVLVPMLQRMMEAGARRLQKQTAMTCGELSAVDQTLPWVAVDAARSKDIRTQAGVYRAGDRLVAVNRPSAEDEPERLDIDEAKKLFGSLPVQSLQERHFEMGHLQGEIWRIFVFAMLIFLIVEGILILPAPLKEKPA
ncbi:MAG TPA: BatA domain-containing protein [Candidatus Saccharimonadales bacterium]|nr:BatA domain-containing protein [Candidatus Saccharimonadales bacterium]